MKKYHHLAQSERDRIQAMLEFGLKQKEMARVLERNEGAISREIARNRKRFRVKGGIRQGAYLSNAAQAKAMSRRRLAKFQWKKLNQNNELREYVSQRIERYWSPDGISGRMKLEKQPFYASKTALYQWFYSARGQMYCPYLYSQRYRPRKRKEKKAKKMLIPHRLGLELRPKTMEKEYRHYEADTMVSGRKTGSRAALSVLHERKAKYTDFERISSLKPKSHLLAQQKMTERVVEPKTLTMDNGLENRYHEQLNLSTFFCDPYSSWQKGRVENSIKQIRRFVPKGTDIARYSNGYLNKVKEILNNKPRKSLGYKTPLEVMIENDLLKTESFNLQNLQIKKPADIALRG